jgi:Domain of unknown function (DUF4062)
MSTRLKIFVSSTMRDDLENERDLVCTRLRELNFEPVNAESWGPDGSKTWQRIREEIQDSHLFLLLLGKRYGWIPDAGAGAAEKRSVTHMEYVEARKLDLPILPFLKVLDYDTTDRQSPEGEARDAFRKEVSDWEKGEFIGKFHLASDLAASVVRSVIMMLSDDWAKARIRERAGEAAASPAAVTPGTARTPVLPRPSSRPSGTARPSCSRARVCRSQPDFRRPSLSRSASLTRSSARSPATASARARPFSRARRRT